jgi:hypothetical protein
VLSRAKGGTSEDTERKLTSDWNSPTVEGRPEGQGRGVSEDTKSKQARGTYILSRAKGETSDLSEH